MYSIECIELLLSCISAKVSSVLLYLWTDAEDAADGVLLRSDAVAVYERVAGRRWKEARQNVDGRRLPRPCQKKKIAKYP